MKIKEFIKAFKDAYYAININRFNAKNAIEDYRKEVEKFSNVAKMMNNLYDNLTDAYKYFPIKDRYDFIQKTIDLLKYGRKDAHGGLIDICGWRALYYSEADYGQNNLVRLEYLYNKGKYDEVMTEAEEYTNRLKKFYVRYGIVAIAENTENNNE